MLCISHVLSFRDYMIMVHLATVGLLASSDHILINRHTSFSQDVHNFFPFSHFFGLLNSLQNTEDRQIFSLH